MLQQTTKEGLCRESELYLFSQQQIPPDIQTRPILKQSFRGRIAEFRPAMIQPWSGAVENGS